jgi:phosphoglycolate phosphatase-like HAD superfamily hydrolase
MIKAKAFIFDIGGTLLDTKGRFHVTLNKIFKEWGMKPLSWQELRECYPNWGIDKLVLKKSGKKEEAKRFWKEFSLQYHTYKKAEEPLIPGAKEVLARIYQAGIPSAISTYVFLPPQEVKESLAKYGIDKFFSHIITAFQGRNKDYLYKKDIIPQALERLKKKPQDTVLVSDTFEDMEIGRRLGLKTVAVLSGLVSREYLAKANPDAIIDSVAQLFEVVAITAGE